MAKKNNDPTLAKSAGQGWDQWGAACGFTSWAQAAEAIGITVAQMVTIRKKAPRKTIRLAMDAVLAQKWHHPVETTAAFDWHDEYFRERRLRIGPCPEDHRRHELTVMPIGADDLSSVCCTCGWVGPTAATDEEAVRLHNARYGFGVDPATPWIVHDVSREDIAADELPF